MYYSKEEDIREFGELSLETLELNMEIDYIFRLTTDPLVYSNEDLDACHRKDSVIYSVLGYENDLPGVYNLVTANEGMVKKVIDKIKDFIKRSINFMRTSFKKMLISASQVEDDFMRNVKKLNSIKLNSKVELDVKKSSKIARQLSPFTLMTNGELNDKTIDLIADALGKYNYNQSISAQREFINNVKSALDRAMKAGNGEDPRKIFLDTLAPSLEGKDLTYNIDFKNMSGYLDNKFYDAVNSDSTKGGVILIEFFESKFSALVFRHDGTFENMKLGYFKNKTNKSAVKANVSAGEFNINSLQKMMNNIEKTIAKGFDAKLKNILSLVSYFESSAKFVIDKAERSNAVEKEFTDLFRVVIGFYNAMPGAMYNEVNNLINILKTSNKLMELAIKAVESKQD